MNLRGSVLFIFAAAATAAQCMKFWKPLFTCALISVEVVLGLLPLAAYGLLYRPRRVQLAATASHKFQ